VGYVMGTVAIPLLMVVGWQFAVPLMIPYAPETYAGLMPLVVWPLAGFLALITSLNRFQNLGMSRWWVLGFAIPVINLWLGFRCLACPVGYAVRKKLDGMGKLVAVLYWVAILGGVGLMAAGMVGAFGELKDSGVISDFTKQFEDLRKSAVPER
jgi:hypothetical protein